MTRFSKGLRSCAIVAVGLATAALAVGCSSPVGGGGSNAKTLTVTGFDSGDIKILKQLGKDFESEHKGWKVQVTQIPEDNYVTKLRLSVNAGDPPDVAYVYALGEIADFQPLNKLLYQGHSIDAADYNQAILKYSCGYQGELYCMGGYAGAETLYYNKAAFKKAGIPFPSATTPMTFTQYAALAAKLTQKSSNPTKPTMWGGDAETPTYYVDPGTFMDSAGKKAEFTKPGYVQTWTALTDMVRSNNAPSPSQLSGTNSKSLFAQGKLAMAVSDNFIISMLQSTKIDWGVAPTPVEPGEKPWVNVWTNSYGIPKGAKHATQAAEFLQLLATKGQQLEADQGLMPLELSAAQSDFGSKGASEAQLVQVSKLARLGTFTPDLYSWLDPLTDAWKSTTSGKSSVSSALQKAEPKAQQGLDATWTTWNQTVTKIK